MLPAYLPNSVTRAGLALLLDAFEAAADVQRDGWDFAVEIACLEAAGLSATGCRWLLCKNYAKHGFDLTRPGERRRKFRKSVTLKFDEENSCVVLTAEGAVFARQLGQPQLSQPAPTDLAERGTAANGAAGRIKPRWDAELREFREGDMLLKKFRGRVSDQEVLLAKFEQENWAIGVENPFGTQSGKSALERLKGAVNGLNRYQRVYRIHFSVDSGTLRAHWGPAHP